MNLRRHIRSMQPYLENARSALQRYSTSRSLDSISNRSRLGAFREKLRCVNPFNWRKTRVKHSDIARRVLRRSNGAIIDNDTEEDGARIPLEVEDLRSESVLRKYKQRPVISSPQLIPRTQPRETLSKLPEAGLVTVDRSDQVTMLSNGKVDSPSNGSERRVQPTKRDSDDNDSSVGVITNVLTARNDLLVYGPSTSGLQPTVRYHPDQIRSYSSCNSSADTASSNHISNTDKASQFQQRPSYSSHTPIVSSHSQMNGFVRYEIDGDPEFTPIRRVSSSRESNNSQGVRRSIHEIVRDSQDMDIEGSVHQYDGSLPGSVEGSSPEEDGPTSARSNTSSHSSSNNTARTNTATVVTPSVVMLNSSPPDRGQHHPGGPSSSSHPAATYSSHVNVSNQGGSGPPETLYSSHMIDNAVNEAKSKPKNGILKNSVHSSFQRSATFACSTLKNGKNGHLPSIKTTEGHGDSHGDPKNTLRSQMKKKPLHSRLASLKSETGNGTLKIKSPYEQTSTYF